MKHSQARWLLFVTAFLVVPFFLRRRPRVERRVTMMARPESIFPFIHDLRSWPLWTEWSRRYDIDYSYGERTAGEGATQEWETAQMAGALVILRSETDSRLDYELQIEGERRILGRLELKPDGACTRVTWRCVWDRAENPYRRYLDLVLIRLIGRDFQHGLENLKEIVES